MDYFPDTFLLGRRQILETSPVLSSFPVHSELEKFDRWDSPEEETGGFVQVICIRFSCTKVFILLEIVERFFIWAVDVPMVSESQRSQ